MSETKPLTGLRTFARLMARDLGITVRLRGLKIAAQYGAATLTKLATDTWLLVGALSA